MIAQERKNHWRARSVAVGIATALSCAPAGAAEVQAMIVGSGAPSDSAFAQLELIDRAEMAELRGGLTIGGINMEFGATLRTLIDNVKLTTAYRISEAGIQVLSETLGNVSMEDVVQQGGNAAAGVTPIARFGGISIPVSISRSPATATAAAPPSTSAASQPLSAGVDATLVGPSTGTKVTDLTPVGVSLSGVENYRGVVVNDAKGFTAALHDITRQAIISSLISTASDRKVNQRLELDVRLQNLGEVRAAAIRAAVAQRLGRSQ